MVLGDAKRKLQRLIELAEQLYERVDEVRTMLKTANDRLASLEEEVETQRALLEALAESEGIDAEAITAGPDPEDGERVGEDGDGSADAGSEATRDPDPEGSKA